MKSSNTGFFSITSFLSSLPPTESSVWVRWGDFNNTSHRRGVEGDENMNKMDRLLMDTSRTFAMSIPFLEEPLREEVGLAYLLRILNILKMQNLGAFKTYPSITALYGCITASNHRRSMENSNSTLVGASTLLNMTDTSYF